jgi:peptidyl-tRNA hydrolase
MDAFGGGEFARLRIGVGRSEAEGNVTDHVLGRFSGDKAEMVTRIITVARDAAVTVLCEGLLITG